MQALNSLLRPITAQIELEDDEELKGTILILDLGAHGKAAVTPEVAARWSGPVEVDEQLLAELERGRQRYKLFQQRGVV